MNKKKLIDQICLQLEKDLKALKVAALETYAAATGEESQAENQYDTRALEASYLASAQAKRVVETEELLTTFKLLEIKDFDETTPIAASALVELEFNRKKIYVFLVPARAGLTVSFEGKSIQVITTQSPLGEALLGLKGGDVATVEKDQRRMEYEILEVY